MISSSLWMKMLRKILFFINRREDGLSDFGQMPFGIVLACKFYDKS